MGDTDVSLPGALHTETSASHPPASAHTLPALMHTLNSREDLLHLFFHLLWLKQGNGRHSTLTGVNIPDTVLINHSRPIHWYFTSKDGSIKMKTKKSLASKAIVEHMTTPKRLSVSGAAFSLTSRVSRGVDEMVEITAGTGKQLQSALADGGTTGLVQNFIDPKSESKASQHNFIIMANWTPNVLYLEKRYNTLDIRDDGPSRASPLSERVALNEASRFVRVAPLVSSHTTAAMERLCSTIARHIEMLNGVSVTNVVIHVKLDEANQPWVLYCSNLRVMHLSPSCEPISASLAAITSNAGPSQRSRSAHAAPVRSRSVGALSEESVEASNARAGSTKPVAGRRGAPAQSAGSRRGGSSSAASSVASRSVPQPCALCQEEVEGEAMSLVARQHVLFPLSIVEFFNAHAPGTVYTDAPAREGAVPPAYALLAPGITWASYLACRDDAAWQDERVALCEACAAGLESVTANLRVDQDGTIRVPGSAASNPLAPARAKAAPAPVRLRSEQRAAMRKAASADRSPPPIATRSQSRSEQAPGALPPLAPRRTPTPSGTTQYR